ncbi:MAG: 6-carboxytetrahydropterin synthase QueD [Deltaproteobacteria bacterium GWA2_55_10]|nr:MAG: 6-carboxytetrahydropterin synthase QueD [Deltaproteobacteria bacterium GWA2_55_10]
MYELTITSCFSSAHNLRGYQGACENLHGHNWKIEVEISAEALDKVGMALDFKSLREKARAVIDRLDHKYLNEVPPFDVENATAENIARHIYGELKKTVNDGNIRVSRVRVWESENAAAAYYE